MEAPLNEWFGVVELIIILLPYVVVAAILAAVGGIVAHKKGRNVFLFAFFSFFLWPVLLVAIVIPAKKNVLEARALRSGIYKKCPHCAEIIRAEANICPHCRGGV